LFASSSSHAEDTLRALARATTSKSKPGRVLLLNLRDSRLINFKLLIVAALAPVVFFVTLTLNEVKGNGV